MLLLASPGGSPYSVVPVAQDAPRPCEHKHSPLCRKPWWSPAHKSYVRVETAAEARERWMAIAAVVSEVTAERPEPTAYVITTMLAESAFRRDVHSGIGPAARGDCRWRKVRGRARRIPGSCRAIGLMQHLRRDERKTARGYTWASLAGLSRIATTRSVQTGYDALAGFYDRCRGKRAEPDPRCVLGSYRGSANPTRSKEAARRAWLLQRVVKHLASAQPEHDRRGYLISAEL